MNLKPLIIATHMLFINHVFGNDCDKVARATAHDQKTMASDIALHFLGLESKNVLTVVVDNYVSWKANQVGCLADVIHYSDIVVVEEDDGYICRTDLTLHTKDSFTSGPDFSRDYKPRDVTKNCFEPNLDMATAIMACNSLPSCPRVKGVTLKRDIFDGCKCKSLEERVKYSDVQADYENFFDPSKEFSKPAHIQSLFD